MKTPPKLSVNINKIATLRNARGGNNPNVLATALKCEQYGAQGITVHPRPDERHIRFSDVADLAKNVTTEFNIEGYPSNDFIDMVLEHRPAQVTLVPDPPHVLTSNNGWDCVEKGAFLRPIIQTFQEAGIRTSIFLNPEIDQVKAAQQTETNRIELYTERFANAYEHGDLMAVLLYVGAAQEAEKCGLGVNAGHDLSLHNLGFFAREIPQLLEVSIGHALICDALWIGLENAIRMYRRCLENS
jgi:pyridoxine 5-phosphate synthase